VDSSLQVCRAEIQRLNSERSATAERQAPVQQHVDKLNNDKAGLQLAKGALEQEEKVRKTPHSSAERTHIARAEYVHSRVYFM